jgi:NAD(P)-dependent dehydrogenase (short-subunit alcohol dehydrogenase family)
VPLGSQSIMLRRPSLQDLQSEADYDPMGTYAKSKLACVLFARELSKRGQGVLGVAAHPGYSATTGQNVGPLFRLMTKLIAQPAERGVLPILYAATEHDVEGGAYYGPRGMNGMRGPPHRAALPPGADDDAAGARLWDDSERLTSVRW